ncbi:hypothetical protein Hanom_Chr07g00590691 [Helianthus anomalus]
MIQNLKGEVQELMIRSEKSNTGFRYCFVRWAAYLRSCNIMFGDELAFEFHNSTQLLKQLTKVVHMVKKTSHVHECSRILVWLVVYKQYMMW